MRFAISGLRLEWRREYLAAVGFSLCQHPDPELEEIADGAIELISQAQHKNGYLNTYFKIKEPCKQ